MHKSALAGLAFMGLASCGDPTSESRAGPPSLAVVVRGDAQTDTVAKMLRDTIIVRVQDDAALPVPNAVVSWVGDGEPFVSASTTNAAGEARNLWKLPTKSGAKKLEARWIDPVSGAARVLATVNATAIPGPVDVGMSAALPTMALAFVGDTTTFIMSGAARDSYGNDIPRESFTIDAVPGLTVANGRTLTPQAEAKYTTKLRRGSFELDFTVYGNRDLRAHAWTLSFSCMRGPSGGSDSIEVVLASDSVRYVENHYPAPHLYMTGTIVKRDAPLQPLITLNIKPILLVEQRADSLYIFAKGSGTSADLSGYPATYAKASSANPPTYTGPRGMCVASQRTTQTVLRAK